MLRLPEATSAAEAKKLKIKLGVLAGIIAIGLAWIVISIAGSSLFKPRAKELDSPQWTAAREHTKQLMEDQRFVDVNIIPTQDDAARFTVVGAVHTAKDMEPLKARLQTLMPDGNYDLQVEVLPGGG